MSLSSYGGSIYGAMLPAPGDYGGGANAASRYRDSNGSIAPMPTPMPPAHSAPQAMYSPGQIEQASAPAGTLGYTYKRPTALIPEDRHPRVGMLIVKDLPADAEVSAQGLEGFRATDGTWNFESDLPLFPGIPHIYRVVSKSWRDGRRSTDVRSVRLIPGRIVELNFY